MLHGRLTHKHHALELFVRHGRLGHVHHAPRVHAMGQLPSCLPCLTGVDPAFGAACGAAPGVFCSLTRTTGASRGTCLCTRPVRAGQTRLPGGTACL